MTTSRSFRYDEELALRIGLRKPRKRLLVLGVAGEAAMLGIAVWIMWGDGVTWQSLLLASFTPVYVLAIYALLRRKIRKAIRDPRNRLQGERTVAFDDRKIVWEDDAGARSELPWLFVVGRERVGETVLVWVTAQLALFVPDSVWSEEDLPLWTRRTDALAEYKP